MIGLFQSISLRNQDALQDMLRLLTLWFKYGSNENVSNAMTQGFAKVGLDTWLHVIPQVWMICDLSTSSDHWNPLDYRPYPNA
jgi:phosphatidylinositol kinase/protein kinase (PI-3  family)